MMHNHPQDVGVTHWKPGSGKYNIEWNILETPTQPSREPFKVYVPVETLI